MHGCRLVGGIDSPAAHPFGAPSLRYGVLRRCAPGRTKDSNQSLPIRQIKGGPNRAPFYLAETKDETSNHLFEILEEWDAYLKHHVPYYQDPQEPQP